MEKRKDINRGVLLKVLPFYDFYKKLHLDSTTHYGLLYSPSIIEIEDLRRASIKVQKGSYSR